MALEHLSMLCTGRVCLSVAVASSSRDYERCRMTGSPTRSFLSLAALLLLAPAALRAQNPRPPTPAPRVPVSNPQQDSIKAALDSLTERLERAEAALQRVQQQLGEQSQLGVQTRSRNRLEINGLILFNGFYTDTKTNNSDVPTFVTQPVPADTSLPNP